MKSFLLSLCFTLYLKGNAQQRNITISVIKNESYQSNLRKYKTFKTTAWVVAGTGLAMLVVGVAQPAPHYYKHSITDNVIQILPTRYIHAFGTLA